MDLIDRLGATIDLKRQTLHIASGDDQRDAKLVAEMRHQIHTCLEAFNRSDERAFGDCLDPDIVLFTIGADLHGREQVMGFFRDRYFHQTPAAHLTLGEDVFHPIGR